MSKPINNFDVMKEMGERGMESIKMAPLDNIIGARKNKHGWVIEIGCAFDPMPGIMGNKFVGGLILADKDDFKRVKDEMERAQLSQDKNPELIRSSESFADDLWDELELLHLNIEMTRGDWINKIAPAIRRFFLREFPSYR